ncbi:Uncharacterised protein g5398 [Pycnogonum litorale]
MVGLPVKLSGLSEMTPDKKYILFGLLVMFTYFMWMDIALYNCVQALTPIYPHEPNTVTGVANSGLQTVIPSPLRKLYSPFNDISIKSMMLDHVNIYVHIPLATIFNDVTHLSSKWYFITPNMITVFHFLVACVAGKFVSSDSLAKRRIACLLFELRTSLDALDGVVFRARNSSSKLAESSKSHPSSLGYFLDGFSDIFGTTVFLIGTLIYLKRSLNRKANGKHLPLGWGGKVTVDHAENGTSYSMKNGNQDCNGTSPGVTYTSCRIFYVLCCIGGQLMLALFFWDRYVFAFRELLWSPAKTVQLAVKQNNVIKSAVMWNVTWFWRLANAHALTEMILVSIFLDKLWEFMTAIQYLGYVALLVLAGMSELQLHNVKSYIRDS